MVQESEGNKSSREKDRRKTLFGGSFFDETDNKWECKISNISETGALIKSEAILKKGSFIDVKISKLNDLRRAEVIWIDKGRCGVRFIMKINKNDPTMSEFFKLMSKPRVY